MGGKTFKSGKGGDSRETNLGFDFSGQMGKLSKKLGENKGAHERQSPSRERSFDLDSSKKNASNNNSINLGLPMFNK